MIRFGVLGIGYIGKRHAQSIGANPHTLLVSMADVLSCSECGAEGFLEENVSWCKSLEELLAHSDDLDIVSICTPNGLHAEQAITILNAGLHVVLEKPIALSVEDSKKIKSASDASGKHVFCVMQNRFSPPSQWLKGIVDLSLIHISEPTRRS